MSTEEFCFGLVDEIVENILDDQSEKYHEEEVIPWTIEYMGELLKETLDFAFVEGDFGSDLDIESYFPEEALEDPENRVQIEGCFPDATEDGGVLSELMEHRFVDISWREDSDAVIPVAPMDSWGVGSVFVTQIFKVNCECEEGEAEEGKKESVTGEEMEKRADEAKAQTKPKRHKKKGRNQAAASAAVAAVTDPTATAVTSSTDAAHEGEKFPPYIPCPIQKQPYPWVGLRRAKKKGPRSRPPPPPPSLTANKAALMEGRRVGQQAGCTCQLQCPPVIYRQIPHTTQSNIRARYLLPKPPADAGVALKESKKSTNAGAVPIGSKKSVRAASHVSSTAPLPPPQCEACFGAPKVEQETIDVGGGAGVYLERKRMLPETWAPRFVDCDVKIPGRRRTEGDAGGVPTKKLGALNRGKSAGKKGAKKMPPRLSIEVGARDDPYDPLNAARLIPNIHLKPGVNVRAGQEQLMGPPYPELDAAVRPENADFFGTFNIDEYLELERVQSAMTHAKKLHRVKMTLPRLKPVPESESESEEMGEW